MPEPLRIKIRSDWDAALTYDSLYEESENRPVFIGREVLIAPLVAEITEPNKRGTYLISGYRGTGKTTLLIEALSRAKKQLAARDITLFPLVLNVSEISASLGNSTSDAEVKLEIEPRRLLIALIRTILDGVGRLPKKGKTRAETKSLAALAQTVDFAYQKATAAKFSNLNKTLQENTSSRSWELALALEDKNVLNTVAVIAAAGAAAFEAAAFIGRGWHWLHAAAAGLATVFVVSLAASYTRSWSQKRTGTKDTSLEYDNSLQQLETDLKDILGALKKNKLRTVVVMEELDKLQKDAQDLGAVIRYFKNLFTQAPALFFFVTDKSYFDVIASAIKRARRARSYAIEHTFFTHRIFVGRPTTEESLQFIAAIVDDEAKRKAINAVAETLGKPGRIDEADQLGRFVRYVLFNASNHLFDLKNELRRFARNEEKKGKRGQTIRESSFLIDDQTLPPEQAALAVFQDLIVEKTRSFEIKGGRTYANEILADSLYALFNELGSNQPQKIESFLPDSNGNSSEKLLLDEQLDLSEAARVRAAVYSLIDDLERGRATRTRDTTAFTWRDDAARAFRYVRNLQKHEDELIAELQRHAARVDSLTGTAPRHPTSIKFENRVSELRNALDPLPADAAAAEQRDVIDQYAAVVSETYAARVQELNDYGFVFEEVAKGVAGGGILYFVKPSTGDPRLHPSGPRGGVLLAFGNTETMEADIWSFIQPTATSLLPLDRAAVIQVLHEDLDRKQRWKNYLAKQSEALPEFRYAVDVVPLVGRDKDSGLNAVQLIAASLAGFGAWARAEKRPYELIRVGSAPARHALENWKTLGDPVFHISPSKTGSLRLFEERDVLEVDGDVVLKLLPSNEISIAAEVSLACMRIGFDNANGGEEQWEPLGRWLMKEGRIFLFVNWEEDSSRWDTKDLTKAIELGARLIVFKDGDLPPGLEENTPKTAPLPTEGAVSKTS